MTVGKPDRVEVIARYGVDPTVIAARSWLWHIDERDRLVVVARSGRRFVHPNYDGNGGPMVGGEAYANHFWRPLADEWSRGNSDPLQLIAEQRDLEREALGADLPLEGLLVTLIEAATYAATQATNRHTATDGERAEAVDRARRAIARVGAAAALGIEALDSEERELVHEQRPPRAS